MNSTRDANTSRLHDLLADHATQYLTDEERTELRSLLAESTDVDELEFDRAAAAAELSWIAPEIEPMPRAVRSRVEVRAVEWLAERKGLRLATGQSQRARSGGGTWLPWVLVAACMALVVTGWWPTRAPSPADQRAALISLEGTRTVSWRDNETGVTGDVVWNNDTQTGYMRFSGLAVNDPSITQYQLWIFDESRRAYSDDLAVDGGVFDIAASGGDVIVPISAKLPIGKPSLFAVTTEPPGGVVKHNPDRDPDRYRIILTTSL